MLNVSSLIIMLGVILLSVIMLTVTAPPPESLMAALMGLATIKYFWPGCHYFLNVAFVFKTH